MAKGIEQEVLQVEAAIMLEASGLGEEHLISEVQVVDEVKLPFHIREKEN